MSLPSLPKRSGRIQNKCASLVCSTTLMLTTLLPGMPMMQQVFSHEHETLLSVKFSALPPSPSPLRSEAKLGRGKFLVASRGLTDPNFSKTVVLLIDYDWHGAMGLIINRPTEVKLSSLFPDMKGVQQLADTLYIGGPVARTQMLLLIGSSGQIHESFHVFDNIYVSSSQKLLQEMIEAPDLKHRFHVYAGHAGWAPGQLDAEVSRGGWHILPADEESIFHMAPSEIWPEFIRRASSQWVGVMGRGRQRDHMFGVLSEALGD